MAVERVSLTTSIRTDIKDRFTAHCDKHGLKINRTLERLILDFLKCEAPLGKESTEELEPAPSVCQD